MCDPKAMRPSDRRAQQVAIQIDAWFRLHAAPRVTLHVEGRCSPSVTCSLPTLTPSPFTPPFPPRFPTLTIKNDTNPSSPSDPSVPMPSLSPSPPSLRARGRSRRPFRHDGLAHLGQRCSPKATTNRAVVKQSKNSKNWKYSDKHTSTMSSHRQPSPRPNS